MAYRIDLSDVPAGVRACLREQLEDAVHQLTETRRSDAVTAVHEARKDLKKARSLLRLVRPALPKKTYRAENDALREIANAMSAARDADVMVETVEKLAERYAGQLPEEVFAERRDSFAAAANAEPEVPEAVLAGLQAALGRALPTHRIDKETLCEGAVTAYERGRKLAKEARKHPGVEELHEWRKRVKDLWYHARLLEDAWPGWFTAQSDAAHDLSDLLGDDHDLGVLAERLPDDDPVRALIGGRRAELQIEAFRLGRLLYAEKPKAYAYRISTYLG